MTATVAGKFEILAICCCPADARCIEQLGVDVVKGYDVVAVEAMTLKVFQFLCEQADIDLITFDVTNRIPVQMKRPLVRAALLIVVPCTLGFVD